MLELLFLLLPVAAFYGYVMGIRSARKNSESQKISQLGFYTKGINYFLHRDKDKAVDEFIRYYDSKVNHSFEEGIALGNLFRERGELDRAIKFHTGLMTKDGVEPAQRSITLLELAKDFKRAGLLDKAEEILFELISYNSEKQRALQLLLKVYEQEKEWHKALNLISSYRNVLAGTVKQSEAEFLCEIASDEFANHVFSKAIDYLVKTSELDIEMIGLLVKPLRKCFDANNYEQHMAILNLWLEKSDSEAVVLELANIILETKDKDSAEEFLMRRLKKTPNISLFTQLLNYRLSELDGKSQERLAVLKSLIEIYQAKNPRFICHKCGFKSNILFWQCPSCHGWEKMKPNNKLNLD